MVMMMLFNCFQWITIRMRATHSSVCIHSMYRFVAHIERQSKWKRERVMEINNESKSESDSNSNVQCFRFSAVFPSNTQPYAVISLKCVRSGCDCVFGGTQNYSRLLHSVARIYVKLRVPFLFHDEDQPEFQAIRECVHTETFCIFTSFDI